MVKIASASVWRNITKRMGLSGESPVWKGIRLQIASRTPYIYNIAIIWDVTGGTGHQPEMAYMLGYSQNTLRVFTGI